MCLHSRLIPPWWRARARDGQLAVLVVVVPDVNERVLDRANLRAPKLGRLSVHEQVATVHQALVPGGLVVAEGSEGSVAGRKVLEEGIAACASI